MIWKVNTLLKITMDNLIVSEGDLTKVTNII